jgi:hypothetical protein
VAGKVDVALMRNVVVHFSSLLRFEKARVMMSLTPRTRKALEGSMERRGELSLLKVTK